MKTKATGILQRGLFASLLLLLMAAPAHAGVIQIDFTATVINGGGPLGAAGDAFNGLITIELIDIADRNPSLEGAEFGNGPPANPGDITIANAVTFQLFPEGGTPPIEPFPLGFAGLTLSNSADGDSMVVFVRKAPGGPSDDLAFRVNGSADLFAGVGGLDVNLPELEELLLSFDFDEANPGIFDTSRVVSNAGSPNETVLLIRSASITSIAMASVPEPGQLGVLGLGLLLVSALRGRKD